MPNSGASPLLEIRLLFFYLQSFGVQPNPDSIFCRYLAPICIGTHTTICFALVCISCGNALRWVITCPYRSSPWCDPCSSSSRPLRGLVWRWRLPSCQGNTLAPHYPRIPRRFRAWEIDPSNFRIPPEINLSSTLPDVQDAFCDIVGESKVFPRHLTAVVYL